MQNPKYSFPILRNAEILQCLADLQIPFTEEDLTKPTPQRVVQLYETFTDFLMGVTREQFSQPSFNVLQSLEYPDLHMEAISALGFYKQLRSKLMSKVGVENFSIRDLIRPEAPQLRRVLSAVINFAKFREERMSVYEQCTQKADELEEQRHALEMKHQELEARVNALRMQRAEQEPSIRKAKEINTQLTNDLRQLKKQNGQLNDEVEAAKKEKSDLVDQLNAINLQITSTKQEIVRLKSRIVPNPEKLKQSIVDMGTALQTEKNNLVALEKKARELQAKLDMFGSIEQDLVPCIDAMKECESEMKRADETLKKVHDDKDKIEKKSATLRDLMVKETQLKRQVVTAQEKVQRLQRHQGMKREAAEIKLKKLKEEYSAISLERQNVQLKIDQNRRIAEEMEAKTAELRKQMEGEMAAIHEDYESLKDHLEAYQDDMWRAMQAVPVA
ncbi:Nuf2 family-domain-containing protein [Hyaloraphidium curvatum]|nr:Nuf2 family-domain-containing protein [Hyaloraphidium curvatum]